MASINIPVEVLEGVLTLRKLERNIANWKLENDEREEAIQKAQDIEKEIKQLLAEQK